MLWAVFICSLLLLNHYRLTIYVPNSTKINRYFLFLKDDENEVVGGYENMIKGKVLLVM